MEIPGLRIDVDVAKVPWRLTRHAGIYWLPLHELAQSTEVLSARDDLEAVTVLIRMDPGCGYPAHEHVGVEEVLVLAGGYSDEIGTHRAGSYLRYPPHSRHAPVATGDRQRSIGGDNPACILFAIAHGGVVLLSAPDQVENQSPSPGRVESSSA